MFKKHKDGKATEDGKATDDGKATEAGETDESDDSDSKMIQSTIEKLKDRIYKLDKSYDELINKTHEDNKKRKKKKYKVLKV